MSQQMHARAVRGAGLLLALLMLVTSVPAAAQPKPLEVIATFSILGDIVRNIGGEHVELRTLIGPGGDAHTFEPTPADGKALLNAALVFENGLAFEPWLDSLYRASRSRARRVVVSDGLDPLRAIEEGHRHGEFDPHIWQDVSQAIHVAEVVRDALAAADPAHAEAYRANAAAYVATLQALDAWVFEAVAAIPEGRRKIVTPHNSFAYFARRYGFEVVGTALASFSTEAQPSAREIADLVRTIRAQQVPAIFPENVTHRALMESIAADAGVVLAPPLYSDALGPSGSPADTYVSLMTHNVRTLVAYLGG